MERTESAFLDKIKGYEDRAAEFIRNTERLIAEGELEKAGELLWGSIAAYVNALILLREGKVRGKHDEIVNRGREIAVANNDSRLFSSIDKAGQQLHANYYHGFLSEEAFKGMYADAIYAISRLASILQSELKRHIKVE